VVAFHRSGGLAVTGGISVSGSAHGFPWKTEPWTQEEALGLLEYVEGILCVRGLPLPYYLVTDDDRARWAMCVRVAAMITDEAATTPLVAQMARTFFVDREHFSWP
jgi:hypothetical protein